MKEIQSVSLNVLRVIADICHKKGLRYTLAFGTLIGAIRHKGFIPWDDDVDILMPRDDYEQLLSFLENNPIPYISALNFRNNKKYVHGITRVCDTRYHVVEDIFDDYGLGIFIDIYPVDGLGNTIEESQIVYSKAIELADIVVDLSRKDKHHWQSVSPLKTRFKQWILFHIRKFRGYRFYLNKLQQYALSRPFEQFKYVGNSNWTWVPLCFEREWFDHLKSVQFEDSEFLVVEEYDAMLRLQYGDYMQLPPKEKQVCHHGYSAYRK